MRGMFKNKAVKSFYSEADLWFGKPDVLQVMSGDVYFKEWIDITKNEILQIYYSLSTEWVSLKTIPKTQIILVNELVSWGMEYNERQALDHLVQMNPKGFMEFHPDINSLKFTNQDLY